MHRTSEENRLEQLHAATKYTQAVQEDELCLASLESGNTTSFLTENEVIFPQSAKSQDLGITPHLKIKAAVAGFIPASPSRGLKLFACIENCIEHL